MAVLDWGMMLAAICEKRFAGAGGVRVPLLGKMTQLLDRMLGMSKPTTAQEKASPALASSVSPHDNELDRTRRASDAKSLLSADPAATLDTQQTRMSSSLVDGGDGGDA